jgi:hypothetical protein
MGKLIIGLPLLLGLAAAAFAADASKRTIIYEGTVTEVGPALNSSNDLWVTLKDFTKATKFVLKPQGICRDELCFPIPKGRKNDFVAKQGRTTWFNLSAFARLVKQPVAHDAKHAVWFFGSRPDVQNAFTDTLEAPNFTLPDINGKMRSLSEFRGKKVLLVTWASW